MYAAEALSKRVSSEARCQCSNIKNWENDSSDPCLDNIRTLSSIFNVTTDYLLGKSEQQRLYHDELEEGDIILLNPIIQYMVNQKHRDMLPSKKK